MSGYQTWHDLLDGEAPEPPESGVPRSSSEFLGKATRGTRETPRNSEEPESQEPESNPPAANIDLPEEVRRLLAERERLEAEFKSLLGEGPPDPDDERFRRMYPVPVHTKETRIEERRQRHGEELLRLAVQRSLERREMARRVAEAAEEGRQQALLQLCGQRAAEEQWLLDRRAALEKRALKAARSQAFVEKRRRDRRFCARAAPHPNPLPASGERELKTRDDEPPAIKARQPEAPRRSVKPVERLSAARPPKTAPRKEPVSAPREPRRAEQPKKTAETPRAARKPASPVRSPRNGGERVRVRGGSRRAREPKERVRVLQPSPIRRRREESPGRVERRSLNQPAERRAGRLQERLHERKLEQRREARFERRDRERFRS